MSNVDVFKEKNYCIVSSFSEDIEFFVQKVQLLKNNGWLVKSGITSSNSKLYQVLIRDNS